MKFKNFYFFTKCLRVRGLIKKRLGNTGILRKANSCVRITRFFLPSIALNNDISLSNSMFLISRILQMNLGKTYNCVKMNCFDFYWFCILFRSAKYYLHPFIIPMVYPVPYMCNVCTTPPCASRFSALSE